MNMLCFHRPLTLILVAFLFCRLQAEPPRLQLGEALAKKMAPDWVQASAANRLLTATYLIAKIQKTSPQSVNKASAIKLERCISDSIKDSADKHNLPIISVSAACMIGQGYLKYVGPSKSK